MYDKIIVDFVRGKLNVAKKRLYTPPEHSGLGLFDNNDFLDAQRCSWIKRSLNLNEQWKQILYACNFGNVYNAKSRNINVQEYPICHGICKSYERTLENFTVVHENYKYSYIFENAKLTLDLASRETLNRNSYTNDFFDRNAAKLFRIKYCDFYSPEGELIDSENVRVATGINFTEVQIFQIRNICLTAKICLKKNDVSLQKGTDIITFLQRRIKGSSHIRKLTLPVVPDEPPHNISKFASNMDIVVNFEQSKTLNRLWTNNMFTSKEKTFFFKLHNNTLGYNVAVAHFVRGHSPFCTFCDMVGVQEQNRETPLHILFECNFISQILECIFQRITNNQNFQFSSREYFSTFERRGLSYAANTVLTILSKILIHYTWECKTKKYLPSVDNFWGFLKERTSLLISSNNSFRKLWIVAGLQNTVP
jgi:hypothetical protein